MLGRFCDDFFQIKFAGNYSPLIFAARSTEWLVLSVFTVDVFMRLCEKKLGEKIGWKPYLAYLCPPEKNLVLR